MPCVNKSNLFDGHSNANNIWGWTIFSGAKSETGKEEGEKRWDSIFAGRSRSGAAIDAAAVIE